MIPFSIKWIHNKLKFIINIYSYLRYLQRFAKNISSIIVKSLLKVLSVLVKVPWIMYYVR